MMIGNRSPLASLVFAAILFVISVSLMPQVRADIIDLNGAANCTGTTMVNGNTYGGNIGGGLCTSSEKPFQLSTLLTLLSNGTIVLGAAGEGTDKFVVMDDLGNSFSFGMNSTGQNGTGIANNAQCQVNGGASAFANACSIVGANGASTHLGGPQINGLVFPATISFAGANLAGQTFNLEFVSMQGTSSVTAVPEPSTLVLLGSGLIALPFFRKRLSSKP